MWAAASNIVLRLAGIAVTAVVARILSPDDFGVYAVALAVHVVVTSMAELGMASAIARSALEPEEIAGTVVSISIGVSLLLAALMATGAHLIADVLGVPEAAGPIRVLAISLALTGVFAVPGAQLTREFRQDRIFLATVAGFVPANVVLVVLAATTGGADAFAWSRVVGQLVMGAVFVASLSRHYRPEWRRQMVGPLLRFGLPLSMANLVNWSLLNADYLILGRLVDAAAVGVYMVAFSVANWATAVLGSVLNGVVVPAFGRVGDQRDRLSELLVSSCRLVALVTLPIGAVSAGLASDLIGTVFGRTWLDATPVLVVLAAYGVLFSFSLLFANVLVATGATVRLLGVQVVWIVALVPAMVVGVRLDGLVGAAWAHVVVIVGVAIPCYLWSVRAVIGQLPRGLVRALAAPGAAALGAGGAAWFVSGVVPTRPGGFLAGGFAGVIVYAVLAWPAISAEVPELADRLRWPRTRTRSGAACTDDPRRVAFVLEGLALGGCPINAIDLARVLRGRGYEIHLFAVEEDVPASLVPYAEAAGFEVAVMKARPGLLARTRELRRHLRGRRVDVVHAFAPWLGPAVTLAAGFRRQCSPLVLNWTMQNMWHTGPHTPLVVGTGELRDEARSRHGAAVWLLEPPVDLVRDHPDAEAGASFRASFDIGEEEVLLTIVGRVDRVMKLPGLLAAVEAVGRLENESVRLAIVGDGNAMGEVRAAVEAVNAQLGRPAVILTGALINPHPAYAAGDIALAMGGSALRALAHGCPVVVLGDNGFARTVAAETEDYFLQHGFFGDTPVPDPGGHLVDLIQPLLNQLRRDQLAAHGLDLIESRFGLEATATNLERVYRATQEGAPRLPTRLSDALRLVTRDLARRARHQILRPLP